MTATGSDPAMPAAAAPLRPEFLRALKEAVDRALGVRRHPFATYRLQFHSPELDFSGAAAIAPYLAQLGVSHVYASPCLKSRRGSTHGYDIVDYGHVSDELGGETNYAAYVEALKRNGLGQIQDVVPNHMSVGTDENAWWLDVLMHGPASRYAGYFDIDWHPLQPELDQKLLLPVLGDLSGRMLEAGGLVVEFDLGAFFVRCQNLQLPLDPRSWTQILSPRLDDFAQSVGSDDPQLLELQSIFVALEHLPERTATSPAQVAERHRETLVIRNRLRLLAQQSAQVAAHIAGNLQRMNGAPGDPRSFDALERLLNDQAYQLVHWKAGSDEMNYRRFFDVTELAAVCMENPAVFDDSHRLLLELAARGDIDGFRIDHIDGLYDPAEYLWRLQTEFLRVAAKRAYDDWAQSQSASGSWESIATEVLPILTHNSLNRVRTASDSRALPSDESERLPLFVVVEKILGADEPLPPEWPVQGTTGYDFLNLLNGLFLEPRGLQLIERHYVRFTQKRIDRSETIYRSKRLIVEGAMQSELQLLAHRLNRLSKRHRGSRDYTLQALRAALREIIASFSVYRTYIHGGAVSDRDRRVIQRAVALARRRNPAIDAGVFDFIRDVLLLEQPTNLDDAGRAERETFIGRMQQVSSPVMAKGIEDTAFYRYVPLASINEVGSEPEHPVTSVEEFHRQNQWRQRHWAHSFLATTTHDTKRSEDMRARLNVLTEIPRIWREAVQRWARWNRRYSAEVDGEPAPSRNDEWLYYQTLVGVWPIAPPDADQRATLISRVQQYMEKAIHEAKLRTSWINPSPQYDAAVRDFVAQTLTAPGTRFAEDVAAFAGSVIDSGLYAAVSQTLLKLTSPGTPDIYQGQELWDFSLVDPDNRRPVDYARRQRLLSEMVAEVPSDSGRQQFARLLAAQPRDDRLKLLVTWGALVFRRDWGDLAAARYIPLTIRGLHAQHMCAFAWVGNSGARLQAAIIMAPRLIHTLTELRGLGGPWGPDVWEDTEVCVAGLPGGLWSERMTGREIQLGSEWMPVATVLSEFPVALAVCEGKE